MTLGGRKLDLAVFTLSVTSWLLCIDKLESGDYAYIVMATVGAYIAGNAYQHVGTAKRHGVTGTERRTTSTESVTRMEGQKDD